MPNSIKHGLPFPTYIQATKKIGLLMSGTALAEFPSTGAKWSLLTQSFIDTRTLHLWVLSSKTRGEFVVRLIQYFSLEVVGISFGHYRGYAAAPIMGGVRNFIAQEVSSAILYNTTHINKLVNIEKNTFAIAALVGKKGRSIIPTILKLMGGNKELPPVILKTFDPRTFRFQNDCNFIIEKMLRDYNMRRVLNGCAQKLYSTPPTVFNAYYLNGLKQSIAKNIFSDYNN